MTGDQDDSPEQGANGKLTWRKFNFTEWRSDPKLLQVSRAARSFWLDLCGLIYEAGDMGRLSVDGRPLTEREIANALHDNPRTVRTLLKELEAARVFDRTRDGFIQSRRILREQVRSNSGRIHGQLGGNPALKKRETSDNSDTSPIQTLKLEARSQSQNIRGQALAEAFQIIRENTGPGMISSSGHAGPEASLNTCLAEWLSAFDLEDIVEVVKAKTAKPRTTKGKPNPLRSYFPLRANIEQFVRDKAAGLPFHSVKPDAPLKASQHASASPVIPTKKQAAAAARAVMSVKGQGWFVTWMSDVEWNGTEVLAPSEYSRQKIDHEAGHILRNHGYAVAVVGSSS